jgi:hypothetical protein
MKFLRFPIPQSPPNCFPDKAEKTKAHSSRQPLLFFGNGSSKEISLVFSNQPLSPESK